MEDSQVLETSSKSNTPKAPAQSPDLSNEIIRAVERQPGDRVRCRRVTDSTYRVNWMALDKPDGDRGLGSMETYRIRASRFLRVTKNGEKLEIEDMTRPSVSNN